MITIDRIIPPKKLECKECFGPAEVEYKPTVEPEKVGIRSAFLYQKPLLRCVDPECGEVFVAPEARIVLHDAICKASGLLMPDEIKQIRKEYAALKGLKKISNKEFAKELGLGEITVARYESRSQIQNKANDNLIRASLLPGFTEIISADGPAVTQQNNIEDIDAQRRRRNQAMIGPDRQLEDVEAQAADFAL